MDEIDYNDVVIDDFVSRFGDPNLRNKVEPLKAAKSGLDLNMGVKPETLNLSTPKGIELPKESLSGKLNGAIDKAGGMGNILGAATDVAQLVDLAKGNQFDTSAEGGGPGKAGGAVMSGASTGFSLGMKTGNPLIAAGTGVIGGVIGKLSHTSAMKEWRKNQITKNKKEDALEKAKTDQAYAMAEGKESLDLLKSLREKQIGIIS